MRTVRCSSHLRVGGCLPARGVFAQEGVCLGVYTSPPWTEFLTHACENITFPQLRLRTAKTGSNLDLNCHDDAVFAQQKSPKNYSSSFWRI